MDWITAEPATRVKADCSEFRVGWAHTCVCAAGVPMIWCMVFMRTVHPPNETLHGLFSMHPRIVAHSLSRTGACTCFEVHALRSNCPAYNVQGV